VVSVILLEQNVVWAQTFAGDNSYSSHFDLRQEAALLVKEEKLQKFRSILLFKPEYVFSSNIFAKLIFRADYDFRYDWDENYSAATKDQGQSQFEVREAVLHWSQKNTNWIIGKQRISWGKSDGIRLLDVINPLDFREFILEDFEDSKIPLWMFNRTQYIKEWSWQILTIFDFEPNRFAPLGTDYYDNFNNPAQVDGIQEESPSDFALRDMEIGNQLSGSLGGIDVSLNHFYTYDDNFVVEFYPEFTPVGVNPNPRKIFDRLHFVGSSFSSTFASWVWRGEFASIHGRRFALNKEELTRSLQNEPDKHGLSENPQFLGLFALDYSNNDWFTSMQFFSDWVTGSTKKLRRERVEQIVTWLVHRDLRYDTIRLRLFSLYSLDEDAWINQPKVIYHYNDLLAITVGADLFSARDGDGFFRQFKNKNRFFVTFRYQI